MSDLKEDTPKLRNFLIEAAKEMVEEILKNPIYYIEDELKKNKDMLTPGQVGET